jgi:NAD(P)-dependent dehydrogenase (short-subunit alcohol dehydrogenase family)
MLIYMRVYGGISEKGSFRMDNKTACVTGTDRGVGLALVKELLQQDYTVFAGKFLKDSEGLTHLAGEYPGRLHTFMLNVGDANSVKQAALYIAGQTGKLDMLINNAAILGDITTTAGGELDFDEMLQTFNINALGALRMANSLHSQIMNGGKLIVNISSEAGSIADCYREAWFAYCMSKTALNMGSAVFHNAIRKDGGRVMLLHPGWVKSYMGGEYTEQATYTPDEAAVNILRTITERGAEIGEKPLYLAADTGEQLPW